MAFRREVLILSTKIKVSLWWSLISIPLIDYNWGEPSVFKENSCLLINLEQLDKTLEKISTDTIYKNELISNNNSFLTKCFKYRKESSQLIWDYIKNNFQI